MREHRMSKEEMHQRERELRSRRAEYRPPEPGRHRPEEPRVSPAERASRRKKEKRRRRLIVALAVVLVLALLGAVAHAFLVHPPELETDEFAPGAFGADRREGVYTFLVVGRDDGGGGNTDTIMVVSFDTKNGAVNVLSIFRDTLVDVPWEIKKINSVYNREGIDGLKQQVANLIGFTPDYYMVMELSAVADIVDAIGGVDYEVPYNMDYDDPTQDLHIHYSQGLQHLNGQDTVHVLRWRKNNSGESLSVGDIGRVEIQHDLLKTLMKQAVSVTNLPKLPALAGIVSDSLTSDLSYGEMLWFAEKLMNSDGEIGMFSLPGDYTGTMWSNTYQNYQSYVFVNGGELLNIVNQYLNPYVTDITPDRQHILNGTTQNDAITMPEAGKGEQISAENEVEDKNDLTGIGGTHEAPSYEEPKEETPVQPTPSKPQTDTSEDLPQHEIQPSKPEPTPPVQEEPEPEPVPEIPVQPEPESAPPAAETTAMTE